MKTIDALYMYICIYIHIYISLYIYIDAGTCHMYTVVDGSGPLGVMLGIMGLGSNV